MECRNGFRQVTDNRQLAGTHPVQLCRINFKMHNTRIRREANGITRYAIVEPSAKHQQQVCLVQGHVRRTRAMHPDHAQVVRSSLFHRTQPVYGREGWNLQVIKQLAKLVNGAGKLRARTHQSHGFLGIL